MALIAEELVQEWLNRQGYFTIRGARLGNHELDLLAVKPENGKLHCRHIEINAAVRPIGYLGPEKSAKTQSAEQQHENARRWVEKKFHAPGKQELRQKLIPGSEQQAWSLEVVLHKLKGPAQLEAIRAAGIKTIRLDEVIAALKDAKNPDFVLRAAGGESLFDLMDSGASSSWPATKEPSHTGEGP